MADFNRDGFPDLVVGSVGAITILLGHGDGTFVTNHVYGSSSMTPVAVGDVNGDGKLDVVSGATVLLGNGDGTFQPLFSGFGSAQINGVALGDLNGDGKLDVVTASFGKTQIFLGNGDGTFRPGAIYPYGFQQTRLADLNRDGRLDLVISDPTGTVILLGNGDGTFAPPVTRFINFGNDAVVGDLNGDGIPDIVTLGGSNNACLNIALGRGDGTFNRSSFCGFFGSPLALGDLNSDGHLDIFSGKYSSVWLPGNGDGTFGAPSAVIFGTVNSNHQVAIADFNGDGHDDILLTNAQSNSASLLLGPLGPSAPGSASLSASSLSFGTVPIWQTSAPQTVTLTSNGPGPLIVASLAGSLGYKITTTCPVGGPLAAGLSCTFSIAFAPDREGSFLGTFSVTSSDPVSSLVNLSGTGLINPSSISVDSVATAIGTPANFRAVVTSNGQPPLVGGQVVFHLPNGASFTSGVGLGGVAGYFGYNTSAFTPGFYPNGIRADYQGGSGYAASTGFADLSVTNQPTASRITLSPAPLDFGNVLVGSTAHGLVAIANSGTANYTFSGATATGDFSIPQINCPGPAAPGNSCYVYVDFKPSLLGSRSGTLTVTGDDPTSPDTAALTGVGVLPGISLSPGSVDFGAVPVSATGTAGVTISNTGTAPLNLGGYSVTGPDATSFQVTPGTCGVQVLPSASCTIGLSFGSAVRGSYNASLTISDDAPGAPHLVALAARAVAPGVTLSPNPLIFGGAVNGGSTARGVVTVTNNGDADYHFRGAAATGDYSIPQTTCWAAVAPGYSCLVYIDFTPSLPGSRTGTLTVTGDDPTSPDTSALSGYGAIPAVVMSPASVDLGSVPATTGGVTSIIINNTGTAPLHVSGYAITGPDATSFTSGPDTCGAPVDPGHTCNITVSFRNAVRGSYSALLTVSDDAVGTPQTVPLLARAVAPILSLAPSPLDFGNVVGDTTAHTFVTITNNGDGDFHFGGAAATGDFSIPQVNCPYPVAPGNSCFVYVDFKPTQAGTRTGTLTVTGDDLNSPDASSLTGFGLLPAISLSPGSVDFGPTLVATTGTASVGITNSGTGPLHNGGYSITGADPTSFHAGPDTCGVQVAPGVSCNIALTFSNPARGSYSASLTISDDAAVTPQVVPLTARAVAPVVSLAPSPLNFGSVNGGTIAHGLVTLSNAGDAPYHFAAVSGSGDYQVGQSTCSTPVAPGGSCSISIDFAPSLPGSRTGTLTVTGDDLGTPDVLGLSGSGVMPLAKLSPGTLNYLARNAGTSSSIQSVIVTNSGNALLAVTSATFLGPNASDFRIASNGCAAPLSAGATCSIGVVFAPRSYGNRIATLQLVDNSPDAIQRVALSGVGIASSLTTAPISVDFGTKRVGTATVGTKLTISNIGNAPLRASSVAVTGANPKDFAIVSSNCPDALAAGASCAITITFKPGAIGTRSASLTLVTNGVPKVVSVPLTGIGSRL